MHNSPSLFAESLGLLMKLCCPPDNDNPPRDLQDLWRDYHALERRLKANETYHSYWEAQYLEHNNNDPSPTQQTATSSPPSISMTSHLPTRISMTSHLPTRQEARYLKHNNNDPSPTQQIATSSPPSISMTSPLPTRQGANLADDEIDKDDKIHYKIIHKKMLSLEEDLESIRKKTVTSNIDGKKLITEEKYRNFQEIFSDIEILRSERANNNDSPTCIMAPVQFCPRGL